MERNLTTEIEFVCQREDILIRFVEEMVGSLDRLPEKLEPGRKAAEIVRGLVKGDSTAALGEAISSGKAGEPRANDADPGRRHDADGLTLRKEIRELREY